MALFINETIRQRSIMRSTGFEYKAKIMAFLGANTYAKDLLEFGKPIRAGIARFMEATTGFIKAIAPRGGRRYLKCSVTMISTSYPCTSMLGVRAIMDLATSAGLDHCRDPFTGDDSAPCDGYTHIWWAEQANVDVADPDTIEDLERFLMPQSYGTKDRVNFLGAWVRPRNSSIPISFSDFSLDMFTGETMRPMAVTRQQLIDDEALLDEYRSWWMDKRRAFLRDARGFSKTLSETRPSCFTRRIMRSLVLC